MSFLKDFKDFALKGNVLDLAVAVIIGGAFGKIVSSLVSDVIMPPIGMLVGGVDFTYLQWVLKEGATDAERVTIKYGQFLQNVIDFLIIAFSVFMVVRLAKQFGRKKEEEPAAPALPSNEEVLLTEIRDLLKSRSL